MTKVIRLLPWPKRSKRMMRVKFPVRVYRENKHWCVTNGDSGFGHHEFIDALADAWRFATEAGVGITIDMEDRV